MIYTYFVHIKVFFCSPYQTNLTTSHNLISYLTRTIASFKTSLYISMYTIAFFLLPFCTISLQRLNNVNLCLVWAAKKNLYMNKVCIETFIVYTVNSTEEVNSLLDYSSVNSSLHNLRVNRIFMNMSF
jgi:predicted secreted protein